ncbi:MAG: hypothetical protein ABI333_18250 [bacterium]
MRRSRVRYSELTSLLDVLFIVVFAALVQASALVDRARRAPDTPRPARWTPLPARPGAPSPSAGAAADGGVVPDAAVGRETTAEADTGALRRRAASALVAASARSGVVRVQVSATGHITHLTVESGGRTRSLVVDVPLLERVPDPNVGMVYLGHSSAALRVCTAVRRTLGWRTLREALVILQPAVPLAALQVALVEGLRADQNRCYPEERGLAVIVDPGTKEERLFHEKRK